MPTIARCAQLAQGVILIYNICTIKDLEFIRCVNARHNRANKCIILLYK